MDWKLLQEIQTELKAPKNLRNTFGGYNYRNAEGILEAAKPILAKHGATLILQDEIEEHGGRIYVRATATLRDPAGEAVSATAYAREPEVKKGMDESQITGAASSYARKYALNGLLLLDDTKDPDTDEYKREADARSSGTTQAKNASPKPAPKKPKPVGKEKGRQMEDLVTYTETVTGRSIDRKALYGRYLVEDPADLSEGYWQHLMNKLREIISNAEKQQGEG